MYSMTEFGSPTDHAEKKVFPRFDFDKISGLKHLERFGIPTPRTFIDFAEAEKFSKPIIGRGFTLGEADNLCIDIF